MQGNFTVLHTEYQKHSRGAKVLSVLDLGAVQSDHRGWCSYVISYLFTVNCLWSIHHWYHNTPYTEVNENRFTWLFGEQEDTDRQTDNEDKNKTCCKKTSFHQINHNPTKYRWTLKMEIKLTAGNGLNQQLEIREWFHLSDISVRFLLLNSFIFQRCNSLQCKNWAAEK